MDPLWLGAAAAFLWTLQCALGLWQCRRFLRHFKALRQAGRVAVGKARGRLAPGVVVLLCVDESGRVLCGRKLQGRTVFADARPFDALNGLQLSEVRAAGCAGLDAQTRRAVLDATENYRQCASQSAPAESRARRA